MKHFTDIAPAPAPTRGVSNGAVYAVVGLVCALFWTAVFAWFLS
jgi:hypothetical protein